MGGKESNLEPKSPTGLYTSIYSAEIVFFLEHGGELCIFVLREIVKYKYYLSRLISHQPYTKDFWGVDLHDKIHILIAGKVNNILQPVK